MFKVAPDHAVVSFDGSLIVLWKFLNLNWLCHELLILISFFGFASLLELLVTFASPFLLVVVETYLMAGFGGRP